MIVLNEGGFCLTALNFVFDEKQVYLSMDTLVSGLDRTPIKYTSKIFPIPHLRSVICGTGNLDLILDWYIKVQREIVCRDINYFSNIATGEIRKLNEKYPKEAGTTTLYHFGFSEVDNRFKGFSFGSRNDFVMEEFPNSGSIIKPQVEFNIFEEAEKRGPDQALIDLIEKQKLMDDKLTDDWVGIGGEIHRLMMTKDAFRIDIIHRFSDYEDIYNRTIKHSKGNERHVL